MGPGIPGTWSDGHRLSKGSRWEVIDEDGHPLSNLSVLSRTLSTTEIDGMVDKWDGAQRPA